MSARDASTQTEDDLGFAAALKLAVPVGIGLWAVGLWGLVRLFT